MLKCRQRHQQRATFYYFYPYVHAFTKQNPLCLGQRYGNCTSFLTRGMAATNNRYAIRSNIYRQQDREKGGEEGKQSILRGTNCAPPGIASAFPCNYKKLDNLSKSLELEKMLMATPFLNVSVKTKQRTKKLCLKHRNKKARNDHAKDKCKRSIPGKGTGPSTKK